MPFTDPFCDLRSRCADGCVFLRLSGWILTLLSVSLPVGAAPVAQEASQVTRPRVVITADPELDDNNTIIRAILYSSEIDFEGLIYASSQFHWRGDGKGTTQYIPGREYTRLGLCPCTSWRFSPDDHFIDTIVEAYAKVYQNLKIHDPNYPSPAKLRTKIKWGNVDFDGDFSKDTEGSKLIQSLLIDDEPGPLYVTAQGGESTIARALKSIYDEYAKTGRWEAVRAKVSRKLIIIPSGDQDGTGAAYIRPNWPEVRIYEFSGINFGYLVQDQIPAPAKSYFTPQWMAKNVTSRGPLGALYRVWGDGKQMVKDDRTDYFGLAGYSSEELKKMGYMVWMPPQSKGAFLGEGDTPTFINLIDNGLHAYQNPRWGGWGGRMLPGGVNPSLYGPPGPVMPPDTKGLARGVTPAASETTKASDAQQQFASTANFQAPVVSARRQAIVARFLAAAQNDFAARLQWSVTPQFRGANHPPVVRITGPLAIPVEAGSLLQLLAEAHDPDHDALRVMWWQDDDAGSYPGDVSFSNPAALVTQFRVPQDSTPGQVIHLVLEVTDSGNPPLTRYERIVLTVGGKHPDP
jgi:hypothetical protein